MIDYDEWLHDLLKSALREDVGDGDHSSLCCIPAGAVGIARLKIKEDGILAGMEVARKIFRMMEPESVFLSFLEDGQPIHFGEFAFEVKAKVHTILQCERLVLNCMQRMSGIATLTRRFVDKLKNQHTRILDTRKTTPNFRLLEKEAVRIGGGVNHRFGLFDMIMLKDNHIDFCGGISKAIEEANLYRRQYRPDLKIEIETRSLANVEEVMRCGGIDRIMLDNFTPAQLAEAMKLIAGSYETEASGGINLDNVQAYAATGVDFVSVGALIHQARSLDLSLKAVTNHTDYPTV